MDKKADYKRDTCCLHRCSISKCRKLSKIFNKNGTLFFGTLVVDKDMTIKFQLLLLLATIVVHIEDILELVNNRGYILTRRNILSGPKFRPEASNECSSYDF